MGSIRGRYRLDFDQDCHFVQSGEFEPPHVVGLNGSRNGLRGGQVELAEIHQGKATMLGLWEWALKKSSVIMENRVFELCTLLASRPTAL